MHWVRTRSRCLALRDQQNHEAHLNRGMVVEVMTRSKRGWLDLCDSWGKMPGNVSLSEGHAQFCWSGFSFHCGRGNGYTAADRGNGYPGTEVWEESHVHGRHAHETVSWPCFYPIPHSSPPSGWMSNMWSFRQIVRRQVSWVLFPPRIMKIQRCFCTSGIKISPKPSITLIKPDIKVSPRYRAIPSHHSNG